MKSNAIINELRASCMMHKQGFIFGIAHSNYRKRAERAFIHISKVDKVKCIVAQATGISVEQMESATRKQEVIKAKHIAISECLRLFLGTSKSIGNVFNLDNHTSVLHARNSVNNRAYYDSDYFNLLDSIKKQTNLIT